MRPLTYSTPISPSSAHGMRRSDRADPRPECHLPPPHIVNACQHTAQASSMKNAEVQRLAGGPRLGRMRCLVRWAGCPAAAANGWVASIRPPMHDQRCCASRDMARLPDQRVVLRKAWYDVELSVVQATPLHRVTAVRSRHPVTPQLQRGRVLPSGGEGRCWADEVFKKVPPHFYFPHTHIL
jgi:hypothetical protein